VLLQQHLKSTTGMEPDTSTLLRLGLQELLRKYRIRLPKETPGTGIRKAQAASVVGLSS